MNSDGKNTKRPTLRGENIGITLDARMGNNGTVYNLAAQHFTLDNLDAIMGFESARKENQG